MFEGFEDLQCAEENHIKTIYSFKAERFLLEVSVCVLKPNLSSSFYFYDIAKC